MKADNTDQRRINPAWGLSEDVRENRQKEPKQQKINVKKMNDLNIYDGNYKRRKRLKSLKSLPVITSSEWSFAAVPSARSHHSTDSHSLTLALSHTRTLSLSPSLNNSDIRALLRMREALRKENRCNSVFLMEVNTDRDLYRCIWTTGEGRQVREALKRAEASHRRNNGSKSDWVDDQKAIRSND